MWLIFACSSEAFGTAKSISNSKAQRPGCAAPWKVYLYYCNTCISRASMFSSTNRRSCSPFPGLWTRACSLILPCGSFGGELRGYSNGHKVGVSQVVEMLEVTPWEIKHPRARHVRGVLICILRTITRVAALWCAVQIKHGAHCSPILPSVARVFSYWLTKWLNH